MWEMPDFLSDLLITFVFAGVAVAVGIAHLLQRPNLDAFPTVGASSWLGSWWAGIKYMTNAADVIREGYKKHNGAPFKIAKPFRWAVIIGKRVHVEELRCARDDELSFVETLNEDLNIDFTLGADIVTEHYHTKVIRSQLTRNIGNLFPMLRDEIVVTFDEILDLKDDNEWKSVPALTTAQQIICRVTNRLFVGLPLCRNPDFVALSIQHTIDSFTSGLAIGFLPRFLRALAVRFVTKIPKNVRRGVDYLGPIIEERWKQMDEHGNWTRRPEPYDLLWWLMEEAGPRATLECLATYVLASNSAAIPTTSNAFTFALYNLAANPGYVEPLREEIEAVVKAEGWSKSSLGKMRKVDSFLKETLRMESLDCLSLSRKAMKDFMFSDGTLIPKGTRIHAPLIGLHFDDTLYENPEVFDPFRFARLREEDGQGIKYQLATTSPDALLFGYGRHACPGRFFAAAELKTMFAHVVITYDVKLEENAIRPQSLHMGSTIAANSKAKVMFRKRARQDGYH